MLIQTATEEYALALRKGQREYREALMAGRNATPAVLDDILPEGKVEIVQDLGVLEIPSERIVGVKSAGRTMAFTANFRPLLDAKTEFGTKWINLCAAHLGSVGIQEPILCYEYLGNFYVQEGNKRVSVLRHFDAPRIPSQVRRLVPQESQDPRIRAYYEFMDFFRDSRLYAVQFRRPGDYAKLLKALGKTPGQKWEEQERRTFNSYFQYFLDAFRAVGDKQADILPEEALLVWLEAYPYQDLGRLSAGELKKSLAALWEDVTTTSVRVQTKATDKSSLLNRVMALTQDHLNVAFVHQLDTARSTWVLAHEEGRRHIEDVFGDKVTARSYFGADDDDLAREKIREAVADGAQVIFTTSPRMSRVTLRAAVEYPKVRFLNCSVDQPYASVRTYYARIYEAKFITGTIAGAMAQNNRIGYIASSPIFGVPASINAFALGAQMTNPRAQVELKWSCLGGTPQADLFADGIRVISNRSTPVQSRQLLDFCSYGTYLMDDRGDLIPLGSPIWVWGRFYEFALRSIFSGGWKNEKDASTALNYWLGMDSGVIGLNLSGRIPEGVRYLAKQLRRSMTDGSLDPFFRKIVSQDGTVRNDGSRTFTPTQILHMDWLCDNVTGDIPAYNQILAPFQGMVRELGIYRDRIVPEKEVRTGENFDHLR